MKTIFAQHQNNREILRRGAGFHGYAPQVSCESANKKDKTQQHIGALAVGFMARIGCTWLKKLWRLGVAIYNRWREPSALVKKN